MWTKYVLCLVTLVALGLASPVEQETRSLSTTTDSLVSGERDEDKSSNGHENVDVKPAMGLLEEEVVTNVKPETSAAENEDAKPGFLKQMWWSILGYQASDHLQDQRGGKETEEKRTVYLSEANGSYVAVVVPSESVMNQLVSNKAEQPSALLPPPPSQPPRPAEVRRTIYLETLGRTAKPVEPASVSDFKSAGSWTGPLSATDQPNNGMGSDEGQVRGGRTLEVDPKNRTRSLPKNSDLEISPLGYYYVKIPSAKANSTSENVKNESSSGIANSFKKSEEMKNNANSSDTNQNKAKSLLKKDDLQISPLGYYYVSIPSSKHSSSNVRTTSSSSANTAIAIVNSTKV